ncbi:hypothetical protein L917_07669 [Phytophthora nicotianae]|uniref:MULE transposase domain-containing protein n=2 Tax=Phytophthora nicotianae TaxID=4792 RepID=W2PCZ5_PHYN3|nr:hypothetical protein PPTG_24802 [Phytophthora nicotianae INRA-310]ETL41177.1 hypothetical protein L916_07782 [Phytophthora nicotianae]ETL94339.1 hypothetical protein L917_07669 [Phytophthora nicotianae]ETM97869.1 hypothetical protein PPTG_24802 [Phytophthora nicotianae INRA-310]
MSMKALEQNAARICVALECYVQTEQCRTPVLACGISYLPPCGAIEYFTAIGYSLHRRTCRSATHIRTVNGSEMQVKYVLGDAVKAQHKEFQGVFADCLITYLLCYYHVVVKMCERTRGLSSELSEIVCIGMYDLHFSNNETDYAERKASMLGS